MDSDGVLAIVALAGFDAAEITLIPVATTFAQTNPARANSRPAPPVTRRVAGQVLTSKDTPAVRAADLNEGGSAHAEWPNISQGVLENTQKFMKIGKR